MRSRCYRPKTFSRFCSWYRPSKELALDVDGNNVAAVRQFFQLYFLPICRWISAPGPVGLAFVFLLQPAPEFKPNRFPRNWLAFPSSSASFGREGYDLLDAASNFQGPTWKRASHRAAIGMRSSFTADERLVLFAWYVERVNRLLFEITDLANFTERGDRLAAINPILSFEHGMTFDRLLRKTILAMSLDDTGSATMPVFVIADLYDTMFSRFTGAPETEMFKRLFHPLIGRELVVSRLRKTTHAVCGLFLCPRRSRLFGDRKSCRRVDLAERENYGQRDSSSEQGSYSRNCDAGSAVCSDVMRCYRNRIMVTFRTARNRTIVLCFFVDGNLPVEMSAQASALVPGVS